MYRSDVMCRNSLAFCRTAGWANSEVKSPCSWKHCNSEYRVSIADTTESEIDNASRSLTVYRLKPVNINQEKEKIGDLFQVSASDIGTFPTGNTLSDGTAVGIDAQTGRVVLSKTNRLWCKGRPIVGRRCHPNRWAVYCRQQSVPSAGTGRR